MTEITGKTRLGCLLGSPVAHSISPQMYNYAFRKLDLDYVYLCFDTSKADFASLVGRLKEMNVFGFNLTMPDKERIIPYLDELTPAAKMIGAVNTVKNEDGRLIGHNTDGAGYFRSLRCTGYEASRAPMTLLGAGGAASSIAVQAALDGVPVLHIVNRRGRSWQQAQRLAEVICRETSCRADVTDLADTEAVTGCIRESGLLTNATSVGMTPAEDACPLADLSGFHEGLLVTDIIYHPQKTLLLKKAEEKGLSTLNGMYMLLYQGEAAFRFWTGLQMPTEEIKERYFDGKL